MVQLMIEPVHRFPLEGPDGPSAVLAGPGGLVGVGSGFGSTTAWVVVLIAVALLAVVARLLTRRRRTRGAGPAVAELDERDVRGGGAS